MCSNNICATSNPLPGIATIFSGEDYVSVPSGMSMPSDYADNGNGLEPVGQLPNLTRFVMTANGNDNELIAVPTPLTNDGTSFTIVKSIRRYVLTD